MRGSPPQEAVEFLDVSEDFNSMSRPLCVAALV